MPWHHLLLYVAIRKAKSPCRQADEVADVDVALIFNRAAMEKTNPPYPLAIVEEEDEEEEINRQY